MKSYNEIVTDIRTVVTNGLPNLNPAIQGPLGKEIIIRSIALLRVCYIMDIRENKPPTRAELCGEKAPAEGLIKATYHELGLDKLVPLETACSGPNHLQIAAHFLSDSGLMIPRASKAEAFKGSKYQITKEGRTLGLHLFGDARLYSTLDTDDLKVISEQVRNKPVTAVYDFKGEVRSAWLDLVKVR